MQVAAPRLQERNKVARAGVQGSMVGRIWGQNRVRTQLRVLDEQHRVDSFLRHSEIVAISPFILSWDLLS